MWQELPYLTAQEIYAKENMCCNKENHKLHHIEVKKTSSPKKQHRRSKLCQEVCSASANEEFVKFAARNLCSMNHVTTLQKYMCVKALWKACIQNLMLDCIVMRPEYYKNSLEEAYNEA